MLECPKCHTHNHGSAHFCESCGESLELLREADDAIEETYLKDARKAVWALGFVAAVQLVAVFIYGMEDWALWSIFGFFVALAIWAFKAPLLASALGLGGFVILHVLEAVVDPHSIYKGVLMKIVIVSVLIGAIKAGLKLRAHRIERGAA